MAQPLSIVDTHPDIARQFHPELNGDVGVDSLTKGSTKKVWWLGDCGHEWDVPVQQRTLQGQGCPICKGKRVLTGFNDLATKSPEVAAEWHPTLNGDLTPQKVVVGYGKKVWWLGSECGHEWDAAIRDRVNKSSRCPVCANRKVVVGINDLATTHADLATLWHPTLNDDLRPTDITAGRRKPVHFRCPQGHEWKGAPCDEVKKANGYCPPCSGYVVNPGINDLRTLFPRHAQYWDSTKNGPLGNDVSPESHDKVHWKCSLGHEFIREIRQYCKSDVPCPVCSGKHLLSGFNDFATLHPEIAKEWHPTLNEDRTPETTHPFGSERVWWRCLEKGHEWATRTSERIRKDGPTGCPECAANQRVSKGEQQIADFISALGLDVRQSVRTLIRREGKTKPQEIDIVIESKKLAIEFNGLYYHSERFLNKDANYHYNKFTSMRGIGYQLIQIWEDDWVYRRTIVEAMLKAKLGVQDGRRIFARKTVPAQVEAEEAQAFLDTHHIQGHANAARYHGLRDGDGTLVAVMATRLDKHGTATIARYATACTVVGGFTKVLAFVERELSPQRFLTFSDNCISDGGLYANHGFRRDADLNPDYSYFYRGELHHKFNFRLQRFKDDPALTFEEGLSERELAELNGIYRVWDAGKVRWVRECKQPAIT